MELAQNAADAAASAGVRGRLLLRLLDDPAGGPGRLLAANTGAPLDAAGVQGLATLRASAKGEAGDGSAGVVGRFGVGFAAVLAVTDAPALRSASGAVRFSREESAALLRAGGSTGLLAEVERREGHVPALRLPFPAPGAPAVPAGYDTVVELPLRDGAARAAVEALLQPGAPHGVGDVLLLALPALAEVVVEVPGRAPRRVGDVGRRWRVLRRTGRHDPADLADRGVEDRRRLGWQLTWALPGSDPTDPAERTDLAERTTPAPLPGVLCSPTPTDEDLPWPAVLVATFPLGPDRRRLAPGRATDALLDAAAEAYCALLTEVAADGLDALGLVPHGLAAGRVDAELRRRVLERVRDVPVLRAVERVDPNPGAAPLLLRPSSAVALTGAGADDPALLDALAPALAGLVAAPRAVDRLLTELGVARLGLADVLEVLPGLDGPGSRDLFAALAPLAVDPSAREAMSGLPVPLLDGRRVHGARGTVLLDDADLLGPDAAGVFAGHGLRVVDPVASQGPGRDLLLRLGAREGGAWAVLSEPAVRAAVASSPDAEDPDEVAAAVLDLVAAVVTGPDGTPDEDAVRRTAQDLPWLGDLALPDADDDLAPAGALLLPGTLAERALDPADVAPVSPQTLREWGPAVLRAVGVLSGPALVHLDEVDLEDADAAAEAGLAGFADYAAEVWGDLPAEHGDGVVPDVVAVRDLDLVTGAWPEVLTDLAGTPAGLRALTAPWSLGGHRRTGLVAWWLRRHGPLPEVSRAAGGDAPAWVPVAPGWTDALPAAVRTALGVLPDLAAAGAEDLPALLRLSAARPPAPLELLVLWGLLGRCAADVALPAPDRLAALDAAGAVVVADAADVVVVESPAWAQRTDLGPRLLVPAHAAEAVADLLDLDLSSDRAAGDLEHPDGRARAVPAAAAVLAPGLPGSWRQVERLRCDGHPVRFWVDADSGVLAVDAAAAACGLAQVAGRWSSRAALAEVLTAADPAARLAAELPGLTG